MKKTEIILTLTQKKHFRVMAYPIGKFFAVHHPVDWYGNPLSGWVVTHTPSGRQVRACRPFRTVEAAREWIEFLANLPIYWGATSPFLSQVEPDITRHSDSLPKSVFIPRRSR